MGWLIVMFDLPVMTEAERRIATGFRKNLLDEGYLMLQFSVYVRACVTPEQVEKHAGRLQVFATKGENVRMMYFTDAQWMRAKTVIGPDYIHKKQDADPKMPKQIEFWE